ncbi:MAG TPA: hypothetical protein DHV14_04890 [Micrococcales bacterium]|uniref:Acetone carboxylase n=1 Tax=Miniimonas arenae TaxID=676201 RepID=A0A5C5BDS0_9MICO|nr:MULTISPECIES: hypothetical protein [Miniimonas]TNU76640.1 hypothetical protein FH969_02835 [Miniimonas arenae]HCX84469.1 hypothetical protein [Micrococcales bacterium]
MTLDSPTGQDVVVCSAKGCRATAVWAIGWRNPRIHDGGRRKVWTACPEHLDHLQRFLEARSFPVDVGPLGTDPGPS